jgi:hypothetical protein
MCYEEGDSDKGCVRGMFMEDPQSMLIWGFKLSLGSTGGFWSNLYLRKLVWYFLGDGQEAAVSVCFLLLCQNN